jgi:hypothetical protein
VVCPGVRAATLECSPIPSRISPGRYMKSLTLCKQPRTTTQKFWGNLPGSEVANDRHLIPPMPRSHPPRLRPGILDTPKNNDDVLCLEPFSIQLMSSHFLRARHLQFPSALFQHKGGPGRELVTQIPLCSLGRRVQRQSGAFTDRSPRQTFSLTAPLRKSSRPLALTVFHSDV